MLLKPDILINQVTYTTRHSQVLIILGLLITVFVTGTFTANVPTEVFADSKILKLDTKQKTNCDTVGADSTLSDSCNQQSTNNVNNGVLKTAGRPGTLLITKVCPSCEGTFNINIIGNNPQPNELSLRGGQSQSITLGPGSFEVTESSPSFFVPSFSGDCKQVGSDRATGTISSGQHLTCTITNED